MADMVMLDIRVPAAVDDRLAEIAGDHRRSKAELTDDALRHYLIDHPHRAVALAEEMRDFGVGPLNVTLASMPLGAVDPELGRRLQDVAAVQGVAAEELGMEILADFTGINLDDIEAIEAGLRDINEGRVYEHEEVVARIQKALASGE